MAEERGFEDKSALFIARGNVRRLLGQSAEAAEDFKLAYDLLDRDDRVRAHCCCFCCSTRQVVIVILFLTVWICACCEYLHYYYCLLHNML